ncbi:iron chelate uptake ABC transporter family permease subunit [Streptomyces sp. N2-109]|uniref:Iron chelate uptake ABC transporter family permease subunit n=2 Tax=Streptomyces gossypii TaxID=2883101 RepID=A0ABT2JTS8_9ACTN|nr:iron chelate uptake ABC transporter family permease subunit [Streptomyces gossypii]MCT2590770.1 iron chelate uptake ABC transporter family permease subunit [Streptomyces gossypii]
MTPDQSSAADVKPTAPKGYLRLGHHVVLPVERSTVIASLFAAATLLLAAAATLTLGRLGIALGDLPSTVLGDAQGKDAFVFDRLRGPRLVTGIATGAAFGLSGALFQSVTRNPLASPDVIGLSGGAGAGAAAFALLLPGVPVWSGALLGALLAMCLVYVSTGTGFRDPGRLVVAGIGVAALATALTQYVVYVVERDKATVLTAYLNGSLAARSWTDAGTIWLVLLVAGPLAALVSRRLTIAEMGDEISAALGSDPGRTRTAAVLLSVALAAGAVSVAGPIAFIALTAPQIARRITRGAGPRQLLSALLGALLLVLADLASQQLTLFDDLPAGIYTMAVGGIYLGYLLTREWRKGTL